MTNKQGLLLCVVLLFGLGMSADRAAGQAAPAPSTPASQAATPAKDVPSMDGEAGPCTLDITVKDAAGKPVYAAQVHIIIRHGFRGKRKVDLSTYTNEQGRMVFKGLPEKVYRGPMEIQVKKDLWIATAKWDPIDGCLASRTIVLGASGR